MAVPSSGEAITTLREIIEGPRSPEDLLRKEYLPAGVQSVDPTAEGRRWIWTDAPRDVGGYGRPEAYQLGADEDSPLWRPPGEVLGPQSRWSAEEQEHYRRHSVDLTMRGGTTSGVVYPLAVCEIARKRRVRNVGGASAGAIAAAAAAAAEIGRSSNLPPPAYALSDHERREGKIRPGFVGLADTISWLCQLPPTAAKGQAGSDEYRLAQLFRPGKADRNLYACATAAMRKQLWALPITALAAFGWVSKMLLILVFAGGITATAAVGDRLPTQPALQRPSGGPQWYDAASLGWAALDLVLFYVAVASVLVLLPGLGKLGATTDPAGPAWLKALSAYASRFAAAGEKRSEAGRVVISLFLLTVPVLLGMAGWWHWTAGVLVGTALSMLVAVIVGWSIWRYIGHAGDFHYGMLAGAAEPRGRTPMEMLARGAKPTVSKAVVPWLSDCLSRLAAVPGVVRFGHLWLGREFVAGSPLWRERARGAAADPRWRLVNLELITTDLTRQRPYRFPLQPFGGDDPDAEQLYFRLEDLGADVVQGELVAREDAIFGLDVIAAMRDPDPLTVDGPDGGKLVLHRLPDPWDLPVVFAVRLSMSLPVLFKAVRLYRLVGPATVRDDLGRPLASGGTLLSYPVQQRAEVLWFSDGGITSNFPVHLFDAALPAWPTFGLNLGSHPDGFPHQDVWLPQDWQVSIAPAAEIGTSLLGFVSSILDTARSWRDTMQTGMPGSRGRVAWVRQRGDEGGTNLYMPREVIASLALRGALAGARLTRRFDNDTQWTRYRWLRLRIALDNMQVLRASLAANRPAYHALLDDPSFLEKLRDGYAYDPFSDQVTWYEPASAAFWAAAAELLDDFARSGAPDAGDLLTGGSPAPHPLLGQIPPM